jgi:DNA-binding Lrp family transcriptional regulator
MRDLDETDLEILRLLAEDARRPFSDISDRVNLSAPAVSDRVDRLEESGIIRRFTLDIDRSHLRAGVPVLVRLEPKPEELDAVRSALVDAEGVEHVFTTVEGDVTFYGRFRVDSVRRELDELVDFARIDDYEVTLVSDAEWAPNVGGTEFALTCAECGNTVTSEGEAARIGEKRYHFCCPTCSARFRERYERLEADSE